MPMLRTDCFNTCISNFFIKIFRSSEPKIQVNSKYILGKKNEKLENYEQEVHGPQCSPDKQFQIKKTHLRKAIIILIN